MSDYTDEMYERYMLTGEGAEFFEEDIEDEFVENEESEGLSGLDKLESQLDEVIYYFEQKRSAKAKNNSTANYFFLAVLLFYVQSSSPSLSLLLKHIHGPTLYSVCIKENFDKLFGCCLLVCTGKA